MSLKEKAALEVADMAMRIVDLEAEVENWIEAWGKTKQEAVDLQNENQRLRGAIQDFITWYDGDGREEYPEDIADYRQSLEAALEGNDGDCSAENGFKYENLQKYHETTTAQCRTCKARNVQCCTHAKCSGCQCEHYCWLD